MLAFEEQLSGQRVLVTGHTGFKGGWLALWLHRLGAEVHGVALAPETTPNFFEVCGLAPLIHHTILDIRERDRFCALVEEIDPVVVFHLAAQPLVRRSYRAPLDTLETNILGTAYLLEASRQAQNTRAVVCVTTDKVYENREWVWPYRENDRLGGKDPYSASKASAELIAGCYQATLNDQANGCAVATVRGGNVIGGGDWSIDRIVPDVVRALYAQEPLKIRNPKAVRPWQHVLSLCHGYLHLASLLLEAPEKFQGPWNFGPDADSAVSVAELLDRIGAAWRPLNISFEDSSAMPESQTLMLDSSKARSLMEWRCPWSLEESISQLAYWYRAFYERDETMRDVSERQIDLYREAIG